MHTLLNSTFIQFAEFVKAMGFKHIVALAGFLMGAVFCLTDISSDGSLLRDYVHQSTKYNECDNNAIQCVDDCDSNRTKCQTVQCYSVQWDECTNLCDDKWTECRGKGNFSMGI